MAENPKIIFHDKKIELLIRANQMKNFKVNATLLNKAGRMPIEELLPKTAAPSTSRNKTLTPEATPRRGRKRLATAADENSKSQKENKCAKCGCRLLRVVDNGRPDKRLILECMRRDCLSTLNFTDLPVGTVLGAETFSPNGYYRDPVKLYYPSDSLIRESVEEIRNEETTTFKNFLENDRGALLIPVPGQVSKARLL